MAIRHNNGYCRNYLFRQQYLVWCLAMLCVLQACEQKQAGKWTEEEKQEMLENCYEQVTGEDEEALYSKGVNNKRFCGCLVEQLEQKYTPAQAERLSEQQLQQIAAACLLSSRVYDSHTKPLPGSKWTQMEKASFFYGCLVRIQETKVRENYASIRPQSYCSCLAQKLEMQYSIRELQQMPQAELSNIARRCKNKPKAAAKLSH